VVNKLIYRLNSCNEWCMNVVRDFMGGFLSVLKLVGGPMVYRYPYRTSAEALRSDWLNIGKDMRNIMGALEQEKHDG